MEKRDDVKALDRKAQELEALIKTAKEDSLFLEKQEKLGYSLLKTFRYVEGKGFLIDSPIDFLKGVIHTLSAKGKTVMAQCMMGIFSDLSLNEVRRIQEDDEYGLCPKIIAASLIEDLDKGNLANTEFMTNYIKETLPNVGNE